MKPGVDYIGIGVGALVVNYKRQLFMARRGPGARNEVGAWEFPGGVLSYNEPLEDAVRREFVEEYGMEVEITGLLGIFNHILPRESQHWVSVTYLARHVDGIPRIREPRKCDKIGWFDGYGLPSPLSLITQQNIRSFDPSLLRRGRDDTPRV
jgi:ADP-ribose pyrophosphatase YjhB (NUDIX family)